MCLLGSTLLQGGLIKCSALEEYFYYKKDTRVETANEAPVFITHTQYKNDTDHFNCETTNRSLACIQSIVRTKISDEMALASTLFSSYVSS